METDRARNDDEEGGDDAKLIPEWSVSADDQVLFAGLAVVGILALLLGWSAWRGGDDLPVDLPIEVSTEEAAGPEADPQDATAAVVAATTTTAPEPEPTTSTTAEATTTTVTEAVIGDVQAAVTPLAGDITGTNEDDVAILTGYVSNEAESRDAEAAAEAVEGITAVDNRLTILEPPVLDAIQAVGVTQAGVAGEGTVVTVRGTINTEAERAPALAAAAGVEGVTEVVDALELSVTADLNELPQVQFATASAEILPESFADLDAAAELLINAEGAVIEVQGYTDVQGSADNNLRLSTNRAEAVRMYLVDAGVDPDTLLAAGFGETEQFGPELVDNRLVRFQQIDQ